MSSQYDVMVLAQQQMHIYDLGANVRCQTAQRVLAFDAMMLAQQPMQFMIWVQKLASKQRCFSCERCQPAQ
jgi:hypothetical protein